MLRERLIQNHARVQARIEAACLKAGRDPASIQLVWVSKTHPQETLLEAWHAGARLFGENKVQEVLDKFPLPLPAWTLSSQPLPSDNAMSPGSPTHPPAAPPPSSASSPGSLNAPSSPSSPSSPYSLHFIGHLQRNKVRKVLPLVNAIHSVHSLTLAEAISRIAVELGVTCDIFFQVNTSGEDAKSGFEPEDLLQSAEALAALPGLKPVGLMTIGPASGEPVATRACFRTLRGLLESLQAAHGTQGAWKAFRWLSMGMTGDLEIAIEEGSHFLRVGTALFGGRDYGAGSTTKGAGPGANEGRIGPGGESS